MEMTSFALGMLTMVGLLFICLIVFGLVKVMKIQKNLGYFKNKMVPPNEIESYLSDGWKFGKYINKNNKK